VDGIVWGIQDCSTFKTAVTVEEPATVPLGSFQRSAQAARLLHETHVWSAQIRTSAAFPSLAHVAHIDQGIRDLTDAMLRQCHRWEVFCDALSMCMGSIFVLYSPYLQHIVKPSAVTQSSPSGSDVGQATAAIQFAIRFLHDLAMSFNEHLEEHPGWLANLAPPATVACFSALEYMNLMPQILDDTKTPAEDILQSLITFSRKWAIGENMLENLENHHSMESSPALT
jgi:hypothetical protein